MPHFLLPESALPYPEGGPGAAERIAADIAWLAGEKLPFAELLFGEVLINQIQMFEPFLHSFDHMLLLGMGGSALGAAALRDAFRGDADLPGYEGRRLWILDNADEVHFSEPTRSLPPEKTLVAPVRSLQPPLSELHSRLHGISFPVHGFPPSLRRSAPRLKKR